MKKILVLAYAVSPSRGSEYSVSWNYIINMSEHAELIVLYGASGEHIGDVKEMEEYLKANEIKNVRFIPVLPNKKTEFLNSLNKKGKLVYTFYYAFNNWHKQAYDVAKELVKKEKIDVVHYLTPIGYREPGYLWKLRLPYIWGPVGGIYSVPFALMKALPTSGKAKLGFRKFANYLQLHYKKSIKRAIKKTDVLIAATTYDQKKLSQLFSRKVYYLPENSIITNIETPQRSFYSETLNLIWIGRIDSNKALIILLETLMKIKNHNFHLDVIGEGHLKENLMIFVKENNLSEKVTWRGHIPRTEVEKLLTMAHIHVISSLTESNTTIIWEAMSCKVPTLSLDHCGMHDVICEKCGIKVPITTYEEVIEKMAEKIDYYNNNRGELEKLSQGIIGCAEKYMWKNRISFWKDMYNEAINIAKAKK